MLESSEDNPLIPRLVSWGGIANVIGGVFVAMAYVLHPPEAPPDVVASSLWLVVHAGFMISLLGGIFALMAFLACYLKAGGGLSGTVGCAMAITSLVFIFGLDYSEVFIFPTLATEFPEVVWKYGDGTIMPSVAFAFPLSGIFFLIGYILFSFQLSKTNCISRESAALLILGTLVFGIGLSGLVPMVIVRIGAVLFGAGLIWTGLSLKARVDRSML
jgi:hypothetical protein